MVKQKKTKEKIFNKRTKEEFTLENANALSGRGEMIEGKV
jgi:hypothetical protein